MSQKNRFYLYAINTENHGELIIGYTETFAQALKTAQDFYDKHDRALFDVRCFDQGAKPNMFCYWSLQNTPRCATLYRRPRHDRPFTHEDLLMNFQEGEVATL